MEFLLGKTVGIDLGTTFSALAYLNDDGKPVTVPNREGGLITQSVVWMGDPRRVIVGPKAYHAAPEHPDQVIQGIKREMGSETYRFEYGEVTLGPEAISAMILRKLKLDAEIVLGPIANAVITVPAYFNDSRRKATQDAGAIAGLNVLEIINEPTAATLAYAWSTGQLGLDKTDETPRTVLVYDLGGGTFDVTVVRYKGSEFRVLATDGDVRLGGLDWTRRLADDVFERFTTQGAPADLQKDKHMFETVLQRCETAKCTLSSRPRTNVRLKVGEKNFIAEVTRDRFEELNADLLQRTRDTTAGVIEAAGLKPGDIDRFILVGGSTRMPAVVNMMKELGGKDPYTDLSPDEAVAHGAAIHASILQAKHHDVGATVAQPIADRLKAVEEVNVNSHSLGVLARDPKSGKDLNAVMIRRNTAIPCEAKQRFVTRELNQQRVRIRILEGDAPDPDACYEIGQCVITDLPAGLPAGSPIEVTYSFDVNGRIQVHARDVTGGNEARTEIVRTSGLGHGEVGKLSNVVSDIAVE